MIFIVVKWTIRPERSGEWLTLVDDFTRATRNEPGNIFFEWSKNVDNPHSTCSSRPSATARRALRT
jgi:quinol monooxygenase YgiN